MTNLEKNIKHYMQLKGIKRYKYLLMDIAKELGIEGEAKYDFADREKANFSKMLNGQRPLKHDFIIPLEKIFGVSFARLLNENAYKLPIEKDNVPFDKGFRYYAYLDDPDLYKNEFDKLLTKDGKPIICNSDEFGKTFLDYIVEYHAVNGVRYMHDEYGIKLKWFKNNFDFQKDKSVTWLDFNNAVEFARVVAGMNDVDLFNDIYDSYNMFYSNGHYGNQDFSPFYDPDYLEILMDNENIFNSLFVCKRYDFELGNRGKRKYGTDTKTYYSVNPILNNCLKHALQNLDKYKNQAIKILKFGINHNKEIISNHDTSFCYVCNELGGLTDCNDREFYEFVIIADETNIEDKEIIKLVDELPKFYRSK